MKNIAIYVVSMLLFLQTFLFTSCKKSPQNEPCEKTWKSLLEPLAPVTLSNTNHFYPRILNGSAWYYSNVGLTGINIETGQVKLVQKPPHFRLLNGAQFDQPYLGADEHSLFQFNATDETWEILDSSLDSKILDFELFTSNELLPIVETDNGDEMQSIAVFDLSSKKKRDLPELNSLQSLRPFKILTQPSVFVKNSNTGAPDTILAALVKFSSQSTQSILTYSLPKQSIVKEISLDALGYGHSFKIGDQLAITSSGGSLYHETIVVFDPFTAKTLWRENAGAWIQLNQDLFKIVDAYIGGAQKVNPENGQAYYTLPYDIDVYSACKIQDAYSFTGREAADNLEGARNHLVILNNQGCELLRAKIPYPYSSTTYQNGTWILYPDRNYLMVIDDQKMLHFFKPE